MSIDALIEGLRARQRQLWLLMAALFTLCFSWYAMLCFIVGSDFLGMNVRSLQAMLDGTAIKPHIYRQFVPVIAHVLLGLSPQGLQDWVTQLLHGWLMQRDSMFAIMVRFHHPYAVPPELGEHLYAFALVNVIDYAFLMAYVYYVWKLAARLCPEHFSAQVMAPCFAILAIPPFCAKFAYIYDFPVLFFSAWLTYVLLQRRLALFTLGVAVATFNKETSFYLIGLFAMWGYKRLPRAEWQFHLLLQCALFIAVKAAVNLYYAQSPGDWIWTRGFYDHLLTNMDAYAVYTYLGLVAAVALIGFRWASLPFILQCWVVMLPFSVFCWLVFGMRNEYRVMYEMFPALLVISCRTLAQVIQMRGEPENTPEGF